VHPEPGLAVVAPGRWSVPVPGTRLCLGAGLVAVLAASFVGVVWQVVPGRVVVVSAGIVLSALVHEGAHAVAARALGYRVDWVLLGVIAGGTSYSGRGDRPRDRAAIAMAGPAASAAVVLVLLGVWASGTGVGVGTMFTLVWFNTVTFSLNLVPVQGSDGWYVIACLAEDRRV
jgi:fatty acid desaturase